MPDPIQPTSGATLAPNPDTLNDADSPYVVRDVDTLLGVDTQGGLTVELQVTDGRTYYPGPYYVRVQGDGGAGVFRWRNLATGNVLTLSPVPAGNTLAEFVPNRHDPEQFFAVNNGAVKGYF